MEKKLTRQIGKTSTAWSILEYGFFSPAFSRNDIITAISSRVEETVGKALAELTRRGYIEVINAKGERSPERLFRVTEDGRLYLIRNDDYFKTNRDLFAHATYKGAMKMRARLKVYAFVHGSGVRTTPRMKPEFARFVSLVDAVYESAFEPSSLYAETGAGQFTKLLSSGIYYTMPEIREGFEKLGHTTEDFISSRCSGVIFTRDNIYILYYDKTHSLVMTTYTENQLLKKLQDTFLGKLLWHRPIICCVLGKSYLLASSLATGYQSGRRTYDKKKHDEALEKAKHMTEDERSLYLAEESSRLENAKRIAANKRAHAAKKDKSLAKRSFFNAVDNRNYEEIYFVRVSKYDTYTFSELLKTDAASIQRSGSEWFRSHAGFEPRADGLVTGYSKSSRTDAVYLPYLNVSELFALSENVTAPVSVVTEEDLAKTISQCLGRIAADFYDIETGEKIQNVPHYDEFGFTLYGGSFESYKKASEIRMAKYKEQPDFYRKQTKTVSLFAPAVKALEEIASSLDIKETRILEEIVYHVLADEERKQRFLEHEKERIADCFDGKKFTKHPFEPETPKIAP